MTPAKSVLSNLESYLLRYMSMPSDYALVASLWAIGTRLWDQMDAYAYLVITAATKRSGKSRLMELLSFISRNSFSMAGVTASTVFRMIAEKTPTMFIDEAETLSSGSANDLRTALNAGYRRGVTFPRTEPGTQEIVQWPVYCPKVFVLIGDVYDTLRDRSIVFRLSRGKVDLRFTFAVAKKEGEALGKEVDAMIAERYAEILDAYQSHEQLEFLADRDAEIWTSLFAVCEVVAPDRVQELRRIAVDMATEKTQDATRHTSLDMKAAEREATDIEYATRLLRDMLTAMGREKFLYTRDALEKLKAIVDAPWRKFRGEGLTDMDMANLLARFENVKPKLIRKPRSGGKVNEVARGYRREDVAAALARIAE